MSAFRHRGFTVLWSSMLLYRLGFWIGSITFQWLVARVTDNSPLMLGLLAFFNLIPMLVMTPIGGVVADRVGRSQIMVVTQFFMAAAAGLLTLLVVLGRADSLFVLFSFAFVFGVVLSFNAPANQAAVANSVPDEDLRSAISLNSIGLNLARIGGPALAAPLILAWGAGASFGLWALVSVIAAIGIWTITLRPYEPEPDTLGVMGRIAQGFDHVRERPPALLALTLVAVVTVFGQSYSAVVAVIAYDTLGAGDRAFTLLVTFTGIGAMLGALAAGTGRLSLSLPRLTMWAVGYSVVQAAFGMSRTLWLSLVLIAVVGGLNFFLMTSLNVLLQNLTAESKRGRVMSLFMLAWGGLYPVGGLAVGFVGELITVPNTLVLFAGVLIVLSLGIGLAGRRSDGNRHRDLL
ncbi:MAG: MFS transporter [bacterium]|nr:MFS transporter [bacterium]